LVSETVADSVVYFALLEVAVGAVAGSYAVVFLDVKVVVVVA